MGHLFNPIAITSFTVFSYLIRHFPASEGKSNSHIYAKYHIFLASFVDSWGRLSSPKYIITSNTIRLTNFNVNWLTKAGVHEGQENNRQRWAKEMEVFPGCYISVAIQHEGWSVEFHRKYFFLLAMSWCCVQGVTCNHRFLSKYISCGGLGTWQQEQQQELQFVPENRFQQLRTDCKYRTLYQENSHPSAKKKVYTKTKWKINEEIGKKDSVF